MRSDHELGILVGGSNPATLPEALWNDVLADRVGRLWESLLEQAHVESRLRDDLSGEALSNWLKKIHIAIILRPNCQWPRGSAQWRS